MFYASAEYKIAQTQRSLDVYRHIILTILMLPVGGGNESQHVQHTQAQNITLGGAVTAANASWSFPALMSSVEREAWHARIEHEGNRLVNR